VECGSTATIYRNARPCRHAGHLLFVLAVRAARASDHSAAMNGSVDDLADAIAADWRWMQRVARALLRDPTLADDACQQAWCAAQQMRRGWRPPRAWLGEAVRRIARGLRRAAGRRRKLLGDLPTPEPAPTTAELVARSEVCRRLLDWLLALEEPVRTTALLHFQQGFSVAQIAAQQACPADTVRWRLRRALDLLRARCDRELGNDWRASLTGMALFESAQPAAALLAWPLAIGACSLMNAKMIFGASMLAILGLWCVVPGLANEPLGSAQTGSGPGEVSTATTSPPSGPEAGAGMATAPRTLAGASATDGQVESALHGTLTLVDERGEHPREDGTAELEVICAGELSAHQVTIDAGTWRLPLTVWPDSVRLARAELGGRRASPEIDNPAADQNAPAANTGPSRGQLYALRARSLPDVALRVVGADTGADLAGVTVLAEETSLHDVHPATTGGHRCAAAGASPLRFQATRAGTTQWFLVCATGYAWSPVEVVLADPGERLVRLVPGGTIALRIEGKVPSEARLRVRQSGAVNRGIVERHASNSRRLVIDGLAAGRWRVAVELGVWEEHAELLAEAEVDLIAGAAVTTTLRVNATPADMVATRGTLHVPSGWRDVRQLVIEAAGRTKARFPGWRKLEVAAMEAAADGSRSWDAGELPDGDYQFTVAGPDYRGRFRVTSRQSNPIAIHVPEPCEVRVRVVDTDSGRVLTEPPEHAGWYSELANWNSAVFIVATAPDSDGWYRFQAPPGPVVFSAKPADYLSAEDRFDVGVGDNARVVATRRSSGIELRLLENDARVPWPDELRVEVIGRDGHRVDGERTGERISVREPGACTLRIQSLDGYAPVDPIRIDIALGEWQTVDVRLRRDQ
jgi:RNA polymerase sigma factor (sigma-70 family)